MRAVQYQSNEGWKCWDLKEDTLSYICQAEIRTKYNEKNENASWDKK